MNSSFIQNFRLAPGGWIHLIAKGEHTWTSADGTEQLVQVIDDEALQAIVTHFHENGKSGQMIIDYDHESHNPNGRTNAAGWVQEVEIRSDGLWGLPRWSSQGQSDIEGGVYRYISPTFSRQDCEILSYEPLKLRPQTLLDAALTNRPNLHNITPITNRSTPTTQPSTLRVKSLARMHARLRAACNTNNMLTNSL